MSYLRVGFQTDTFTGTDLSDDFQAFFIRSYFHLKMRTADQLRINDDKVRQYQLLMNELINDKENVKHLFRRTKALEEYLCGRKT